MSLEDVVEGGRDRLDGISTWKELCRRCVANECNWSGRGSVTEGGYLSYSSEVRWFRVDELERTVLAITETSPDRTLSVRALEDGKLLWSLPAVNNLDLSNGCLLLWRNNGGIEVWKRANDVVKASTPVASPLREPSPLAATASQLKQSPFALDKPRDLRGVYLPHAFLPSFTGAPFRIARLKAPLLAAVDIEAAHVVRLYDVDQGVLLRCFDLDVIIHDNVRDQQPAQFVLLDIDLSPEYLCVCFDSVVVVVPLYDDGTGGPSAGNKTPAFVYVEDQGPFEVQRTVLQLSKDAAEDLSSGDGGIVLADKYVSAVKVSGADALEAHIAVPPPLQTTEEESRALIRPGARWTSGLISAKFSPDGRHLIAGTVFSLLYLFPDFSRVLRGTTDCANVVQKLNIGEPVRDLLWDVHPQRVALRTEPGDIYIVDLNPGYYMDVCAPPEAAVSFARARLLRLRDFASLYGTLSGNMQMDATRLWFVWDVAQVHENVQNRVKEQGKTLTYAPSADGRPARHYNVDEKVVTVCFVDFADRF
ncbi:uncharacterized protein PHACADRAFT_259176 [Phanerochaete carnosa HHB-10118-sp]|uniref:Uncharacterized protein n=1 Tax=Phanerochaete carnosa (strain HHB-10118-sp) TaxID=650164 RepID=K5USU6_PHACS|nr:uncharacterized protein PHACADRAFT_259176 [Phanerochaete carnosa HHB-10118-sp]EKM53006.1 hypothetical protein PHACADRAFT_259176 [Phanerochaete carnosa HHB-10118-sp]